MAHAPKHVPDNQSMIYIYLCSGKHKSE
jgi:hypothetical protein